MLKNTLRKALQLLCSCRKRCDIKGLRKRTVTVDIHRIIEIDISFSALKNSNLRRKLGQRRSPLQKTRRQRIAFVHKREIMMTTMIQTKRREQQVNDYLSSSSPVWQDKWLLPVEAYLSPNRIHITHCCYLIQSFNVLRFLLIGRRSLDLLLLRLLTGDNT